MPTVTLPTTPAGNVSVSVGRDLAQARANIAETDAQTAITNAAAAQSAANSAAGAAGSASSTANTAETNAQTALTNAVTAQSTANGAASAASTAQATANSAESAASAAQSTANSAASAASSAQTSASQAETAAQSGITNATAAQAAALAAQGATPPAGRLFVPAAYWCTTGAQTTTLQAANDQVDFSWIQECSMGLTSVCVYIGSVSTHGNVNFALWSDAAGAPGSLMSSLGSVDSGTAPGWVTVTFSSITLTRSTRYHLIISGSASKSFTIASNRITGTNATGYPCDIKSYTALSGAGTWTPLSMNGLDANFLVILNPGTNGNPALWYGRFLNEYVNIPGTGFLTTPIGGL